MLQQRALLVLSLLPGVLAASACAPGVRPFPLAEPMLEDDDRRHVEVQPEEYYSPFAWDGLDQTIFRPLTRVFAVDPIDPAVNVNALDEVPNSSWFENRLGLGGFTPDEARRGACPDERIDWEQPWTVTDAKPNGANPGFIIRDGAGRRYLLKFDGLLQPERATTADVFGSRLYHAVGYHSPCNFIVFFDPAERLALDPEAESENAAGEEVPLTQADVDRVLAAGYRLSDGRVRASASLFLSGRPVGPWTYQDTNGDDPNDVIPHQERRELRGGRVLAAWLNHFDAREQNTLAMWVEEDGRNFVRHHYIDFGDCFGSDWEIEALTARIGHANYLDLSYVAEDFLTLGAVPRPWYTNERSKSAPIFGYFDVAWFEPDRWEPGYPNPAFSRMAPEDGAWMARILAHVSDEHVRAMLDEAAINVAEYDAELYHTLLGRRDRILDHYLRARSPLSHFEVMLEAAPSGGSEQVCFTDLAAKSGVFDPAVSRYESRMYFGDWEEPAWERVESVLSNRSEGGRACVSLTEAGQRPAASAGEAAPDDLDRYAILDLFVRPVPGDLSIPPVRLHFYDRGGSGGFVLVGVERPDNDDPPAE